jgi:secreted trypsin-like serine protease
MAIQDEEGVYYQIGIFSFFDIDGCIRGIPVVGTKLANYVEWIFDVTGIPPNE